LPAPGALTARRTKPPIPDWWNGPAPSFGDPDARLLVVGLAPGRTGANRTGRPFTGDFAGVLLYETLIKAGFARGSYAARPDDGLMLVDCVDHQRGPLRPPGNSRRPARRPRAARSWPPASPPCPGCG